MSDQTRSTVTISVDLKKYRIRIFKAFIHQMGDAKYVQLLVNPEEMAVALVFAEKESSGDQTHRLSLSTLASDNSVEIYSRQTVRGSRRAQRRPFIPLDRDSYARREGGRIFVENNSADYETGVKEWNLSVYRL